MTAPLRISAKVEIDATQAVQGGNMAAGAVGTIGQAADTTSEKLDRLRQEAARIGALGSNIRIFPANEEGRALDNLRAKYNPLYAAIRTYKQEVIAIRAAHAGGALGIDEMTAAIQRQRQATLASIDAIKGRNSALADMPVRAGRADNGFAATNAMFQFQDIGMTAAMGMSPAMIGLQQGSQLAGAYSGMSFKEAAATTGSALANLVSPVSLATIALTAGAAAAIQFGMSLADAEDETEKLDVALERHANVLQRLEQRYGSLIDAAKGYGAESTRILTLDASADARAMRNAATVAGREFFNGEVGVIRQGVRGGGDLAVSGDFRMFEDALKRLRIEAKEGRPDFEAFYESIYRTAALAPAYAKKADELGKLVAEYRNATRTLEELERIQRRLFETVGPNGMLLSQGAASRNDMGNLALFESQQAVAARRRREAFDAEVSGLNARNPQERADAARRAAAAQYDESETAADRRTRIEQAGTLALIQAEKQLKDAQLERGRAREANLRQQQLELSLIGQSVGEQARLRMEFQLTSELKAEAARNGTEVSRGELEQVRRLAAEHGKLAEQLAARKALTEQSQELSDLRAQLAVAGQAEQVRARVLVHLETERRIREMGLSLGNAEAEQYRRNAGAIASATTELRKQEAAWKEVRGTAEGAIDTLVDRFAEGDFAGGLETIAKDATKTLLQLGVANPLKNEFLGTDYGTMADIAGLGGLARGLFGGGGMSTASMSVNAAAVTINGGIGAGLGPLLGANDNAAGGPMGAYRAAIAKIESGGNYNALGPLTGSGDRAYGKYQVMGNNIGPWSQEALGRTLSSQQFLADPAAQDSIFDHFFGKSLSKYGNASDAASVWFTGRPLAQGGGAADVLGTTGVDYVKKFNAALGSVTSTAETATQELGTFGNGVGQLGQALSTGAQGGSGGGLFNWLGSIFGGGGGVSPLSPSWQANTTFGNFLAGTPGFDKGGATGGSNPSRVAGLVHEQEFVFDAAATARIGVGNLEALRRGRMPGYQRGGLATTKAAYPVVRFGSPSEGAAVPSVTNVFQNYSTAKMEHVESRADERGNRQEIYVISEMVGTGMSAKGGDGERTLRQRYGVKPRGIAR